MIFIKRERAPRAGEHLMSEMNRLSIYIEELRSNLDNKRDSYILRVAKSFSFINIEKLDLVWYEALRDQFNDCCAYCETHVGSKGVAAYFRPVDGVNVDYNTNLENENEFEYSDDLAYYNWLGYRWSNLVYSCPACDNNKANFFPVNGKRSRLFADIRHESHLIIDPCKDNPEEHLYYDSLGHIIAKSRKGQVTINILHLNRDELIWNRREQMLRMRNLLEYDPYLSFLKDTLRNEQFSKSIIKQVVAEWIVKLAGNRLLELMHSQGSLLRKIYGSYQTTKQFMDIVTLYCEPKSERYDYSENLLSKGNRIEYIELRNVRGITFKHTFERKGKNESWFMLLGENGTGKTTVLKAVAMALTGSWRGLGIKASSFLTSGDRAEILVKFEGANKPVRVQINHQDVIQLTPPPPMPVVAYGAVRLIPNRPLRQVNQPEHWNNVRNLFANKSPGYFVNHPAEWLEDQENLIRDIARTILDVLPFEGQDQIGMVVERGKAYIELNGHRIALHELSSGYQSVIALITDIARTLHQTSGISKFAEGVVLIDEIDAHLHPSWKLTIVDRLRTAFPRMQFIVTSHDPLCLRGTHYGEIAVMKRTGENVTIMKDLPDHEGMRVDQILTSEFFDLNTTLDSETDNLITQYQRLLVQRELGQQDIVNLNAIENKLDNPSIRYLGYTNRERMMYQVIDQFIAKRKENNIAYNELDEETKAELLHIWEMDDEENL
ncbi:hypothetical protein D3C75_353460 [compost metagenome]